MATREDHINTSNTYGGEIKLAGYTVANVVEVEGGMKAVRCMRLPQENTVAGFGRFSATRQLATGVSAALTGAAMMSLVWLDPSMKAVVRKVWATFYSQIGGVNTAAGTVTLSLVRSRNYTLNGAGNGGLLITVDGGPRENYGALRGLMDPSAGVYTGLNTPAATGAGSRTADTNPIGVLVGGFPSGAGSARIIDRALLYDCRPGEWPLELHVNMGIDILVTTPAPVGTGASVNWNSETTIVWDELPVDAD